MNVHKMWVIVRKEWAEVFRNRFVLFTVGFLPLILTALPLIILGVSGSAEGLTGLSGADMPANFESLCEGLEGSDCLQYFFVTQFMLLFMLMPLAIPVTIASYSIVGEKTTRTLEPVLATPITTLRAKRSGAFLRSFVDHRHLSCESFACHCFRQCCSHGILPGAGSAGGRAVVHVGHHAALGLVLWPNHGIDLH